MHQGRQLLYHPHLYITQLVTIYFQSNIWTIQLNRSRSAWLDCWCRVWWHSTISHCPMYIQTPAVVWGGWVVGRHLRLSPAV